MTAQAARPGLDSRKRDPQDVNSVPFTSTTPFVLHPILTRITVPVCHNSGLSSGTQKE